MMSTYDYNYNDALALVDTESPASSDEDRGVGYFGINTKMK